jgi:hypothetical protein
MQGILGAQIKSTQPAVGMTSYTRPSKKPPRITNIAYGTTALLSLTAPPKTANRWKNSA